MRVKEIENNREVALLRGTMGDKRGRYFIIQLTKPYDECGEREPGVCIESTHPGMDVGYSADSFAVRCFERVR